VNGVEGVFAEFGEEDPAIFCEFNLSSTVIQRNKIYNPTYGTNSWAEPHGRSEITVDDYNALLANNPNNLSIGEDGGKYYKEEHHSAGPQGVTFWFSEKGNNVIRYNEIYSNNGNYLYDPMGGVANKGHYGFPGADSDIYGNYIANSWDDGIETKEHFIRLMALPIINSGAIPSNFLKIVVISLVKSLWSSICFRFCIMVISISLLSPNPLANFT
jgi:hypothetical protein